MAKRFLRMDCRRYRSTSSALQAWPAQSKSQPAGHAATILFSPTASTDTHILCRRARKTIVCHQKYLPFQGGIRGLCNYAA
jgi:hypothetical protein